METGSVPLLKAEHQTTVVKDSVSEPSSYLELAAPPANPDDQEEAPILEMETGDADPEQPMEEVEHDEEGEDEEEEDEDEDEEEEALSLYIPRLLDAAGLFLFNLTKIGLFLKKKII